MCHIYGTEANYTFAGEVSDERVTLDGAFLHSYRMIAGFQLPVETLREERD